MDSAIELELSIEWSRGLGGNSITDGCWGGNTENVLLGISIGMYGLVEFIMFKTFDSSVLQEYFLNICKLLFLQLLGLRRLGAISLYILNCVYFFRR